MRRGPAGVNDKLHSKRDPSPAHAPVLQEIPFQSLAISAAADIRSTRDDELTEMNKRQFKAQASSERAAGGFSSNNAFVSSGLNTAFGKGSGLSYLVEPPDFSSVSDANVRVALKNLSKRDGTTKLRALEDLQSYFGGVEAERKELESALLSAWTSLYPRLSIDSERRVRQLSHSVLGNVAAIAGRRIAPFLSSVAGPWLAGTQDIDRMAGRAAIDAFHQIFSSDEKRRNFWKLYLKPILEHARDRIILETVHTLSDERVVSPEEAEAKYAGVVATGIRLVSGALTELDSSTLEKERDLLECILRDKKLWDFATHKHQFVRKSLYQLLSSAMDVEKELVRSTLPLIGSSILSSALTINQSGSSSEYSKALAALTVSFPEGWSAASQSKKWKPSRLVDYLRGGAQGGPSEIWQNHATIFLHLPEPLLPRTAPEGEQVLQALRGGLCRRDERIENIPVAWASYFRISSHIIQHLADEDDQQVLVEQGIIPVFRRYQEPSAASPWTAAKISPSTCALAFKTIWDLGNGRLSHLLEDEWSRLGKSVADTMRTPISAESAGHSSSEKTLAAQGRNWVSLNKAIWHAVDDAASARQILRTAALVVLDTLLERLRQDCGQPTGLALLLESILAKNGEVVMDDGEGFKHLSDFFTQTLPTLAMSPSFTSLLRSYALFHAHATNSQQVDLRAQTKVTIGSLKKAILAAPGSHEKTQAVYAITSFLHEVSEGGEANDQELESLVASEFQQAMGGSSEKWPLLSDALADDGKILSTAARETLIAEMMNSLSIKEKAESALEGLDLLTKRSPAMIKQLASTNHRFLVDLLSLTESSNDELAGRAEALHTEVDSILATDQDALARTTVGIIHEGLFGSGARTMSVPYLLECAQKAVEAKPDVGMTLAMDLLPAPEAWMAELRPFEDTIPNPALAITDRLGHAVDLVSDTGTVSSSLSRRKYDNAGLSLPLRAAMYVTTILRRTDVFEHLADTSRAELLVPLLLTRELARDELGLKGANELWTSRSHDADSEIMTFIEDSHNMLKKLLGRRLLPGEGAGLDVHPSFASISLQMTAKQIDRSSSVSYYHARVWTHVTVELSESYGWSGFGTNSMLEAISSERGTLSRISALKAYRNARVLQGEVLQACNELLSNLSGVDYSGFEEQHLSQLILLEAVVQWDGTISNVPRHRLVMFVKRVLGWLDAGLVERSAPAALSLSLLNTILPSIRDVYGSHWTSSCDIITRIQRIDFPRSSLDSRLPLIHASLELFQLLRMMAEDGDEDDDEGDAAAKDAWDDHEGDLHSSMQAYLHLAPDTANEDHQPLKLVNAKLARLIDRIPGKAILNAADLYSLLYAASSDVRQAALGLLRRFVPWNQQSISVEAAIDNHVAEIPTELVSLIIKTPAAETNINSGHGNMPSALQGFLYSWILGFDHFIGSSFKVQSHYSTQLKEGSYLSSLLGCVFAILGHDRGKPIDPSQYTITEYAAGVTPSPDREAQWLAVHLYYRALKHVPALVKSWWIESAGRQTSSAIETWTEKYMSPLAISDECDKVTEWLDSGSQQDDDGMKIKVSKGAREITASYNIDDQMMQIVIRLPGAYPLRQATVEGVSRVGVDEKKWRSWLLNTQGVIKFSNGSIIDGLSAWRKNVSGAIKGQTECAICYAMVSVDNQLPSKKCGTCKNSFHAGCLYRWFKSSNSSSCPLCRNAFHYG